jgi:hypothetical protein
MKGNPMDVAPGGGYEVRIPLPAGNYDRALLAVNMQASSGCGR